MSVLVCAILMSAGDNPVKVRSGSRSDWRCRLVWASLPALKRGIGDHRQAREHVDETSAQAGEPMTTCRSMAQVQ